MKPFLRESLDSAICQTYKNLEILIIDDGSTDGSGEICDDYLSDNRVTVIHQENKGLSAARNTGLDIMTGEYIAFLDSDDAYKPTFVEEMVNAIEKEEADIVICKYTAHYTVGELKQSGTGRLMPDASPGLYGHIPALQALVCYKINVSAWNKLYKRHLWNDIRYPDGHVFEDIDTMYRIFDICDTICVIDSPLYLYRRRPGSITDTVSIQNIRDRCLAYTHYAAFVNKHTPKLFSKRQLRKIQLSQINWMIANYIRIYVNSKSLETDTRIQNVTIEPDELRNIIVDAGIQNDISRAGIRTKVAYQLIRVCPQILKVIYPVYHPFRLLVYMMCGK